MASASFVLPLALLAVLMVVVASEQPPDSIEMAERKPEEATGNKRASFFVGSRYGRSYYGNSKSGRVNVAPRNDRFFLGSRYGKRNNEYIPATDAEQQDSNSVLTSSTHAKFFTMSCVHTGFKNFFRCNSVNDIDNYIQRLTNDEQ